eukprot:scaffold10656_cov48-Attheya_sp.AAC.1
MYGSLSRERSPLSGEQGRAGDNPKAQSREAIFELRIEQGYDTRQARSQQNLFLAPPGLASAKSDRQNH